MSKKEPAELGAAQNIRETAGGRKRQRHDGQRGRAAEVFSV